MSEVDEAIKYAYGLLEENKDSDAEVLNDDMVDDAIADFMGDLEAGWTSLILSIWFLGGVQLFSIGLIGKYIGKIYTEVKHRPRYNIECVLDEEDKE